MVNDKSPRKGSPLDFAIIVIDEDTPCPLTPKYAKGDVTNLCPLTPVWVHCECQAHASTGTTPAASPGPSEASCGLTTDEHEALSKLV